MTTMPDFAVHAVWPVVLPEDADERLLGMRPGTVVSHPLEGGTVVAVPITTRGDDLEPWVVQGWAKVIGVIAKKAPVSVTIDPLEEV